MKRLLLRTLFWLLYLTVLILILEGGSYMILMKINPNYGNGDDFFNRRLSGYTIFENTPDFKHQTFKTGPDQKTVVTDSMGYISDIQRTDKRTPTFRIVLNGGSAMMGSGQSGYYQKYHKYHRELYAYEISIAGKLRSKLRAYYPDVNFEVINAASYTKMLHQTLIEYVQRISKLKPDLLIQMDGYNDVYSFTFGNPFDLSEDVLLNFYIDLHDRSSQQTISHTVNLLNIILKAKTNRGDIEEKNVIPYELSSESRQEYYRIRSELKTDSERFFYILEHYCRTLSQDSVQFIYSIQPMLNRIPNKTLSSIEEKLIQRSPYYSLNLLSHLDEDTYSLMSENDTVFKSLTLALCYMWDDFVAADIDTAVEHYGGSFIDFGREVLPLDKDFELYTDYCHLTEAGNEFIAEEFFRRIVEKDMVRKGM